MNRNLPFSLLLILCSLFVMLTQCTSQGEEKEQDMASDLEVDVMTKAKQDSMSFKDVLDNLMQGNDHFLENRLTSRNNIAQLQALIDGQHPKAVVLSCIDSRVPVEEVFDQGVGDLFVIRVAGNIDNDHNIASMEYGCKVSGAKVLMVMGHEECGAIKSAIKGVDMGNITELLAHIQPSIDKHTEFTGERSVDNHDYIEMITKDNALMTLDDIRTKSEIIRNMEMNGEVILVAAYYDMHTGKVTIINKEEIDAIIGQ